MGSLVYQVTQELKGQLRIGESKHDAKLVEHTQCPEGIFSFSTLETYIKQCCSFVKWAKAEYGKEVQTLQDCRPYVGRYLQRAIDRGDSAWSIRTYAAALAKLYHTQSTAFGVELPTRHRQDITRSRGPAEMDRGVSKAANADVYTICRATGCRRHELVAMRAEHLDYKDGQYYMRIVGKGGKERFALIRPDMLAQALPIIQARGAGRVFDKIPAHLDVHAERREYAQALYKALARPIEAITDRGELYVRQGKKDGAVFDRVALLQVSKYLGHNRANVIANNYL